MGSALQGYIVGTLRCKGVKRLRWVCCVFQMSELCEWRERGQIGSCSELVCGSGYGFPTACQTKALVNKWEVLTKGLLTLVCLVLRPLNLLEHVGLCTVIYLPSWLSMKTQSIAIKNLGIYSDSYGWPLGHFALFQSHPLKKIKIIA